MKLEFANALGFALALALAMLGPGAVGSDVGAARSEAAPRSAAVSGSPERLPSGSPALRDAGGTLVPLIRYERIVSGSLAADRLLLELCEPTRIVAFTRYAARGPNAHRYAGKPTVDARDDVEQMLALKPDLLVASDLVNASYVARLREHGVQVFQLGPMQGLGTLLPNIHAIGQLIGAPERAARLAAQLMRRMEGVATAVRDRPRPRALYLSSYGGRLFGAARHTSYHDMIRYAGLRDVAAERGLSGWPELSTEQVLALQPEVLITRTGMGALVCRHPGLERLCAGARIIELEGALLDDPSPALLEATEALYSAYWLR